MRRALCLVPLLIAPALAQERAVAPEERVFVETETPRDTVFVQETFRVTLRVGFDREWFGTSGVPLFQRPTGVPVQALAPWIEGVADTLSLAPGPVALVGGGPTIALNDAVVAASEAPERVRDGRAFRVIEIERTYRAARGGDLVLPAAQARFAYGTRFTEDIVNGRLATDRRDVIMDGKPLTLHVKELPADGRPAGFGGAVGRFAVSATLDKADVSVGESVRVALRIEGDGNLDVLAAPRLDDLAGFHVLGSFEPGARTSGVRTFVYDMTPLPGGVTGVPAIPFSFFDPGPPAAYRTVATQPIPLKVRGTGPADAPPAGDAAPQPRWTWGIVLAIAVAIVVALRARTIAKRGPEHPADGAAAAFRHRVALPGADAAQALTEYLAERLRCPAAAVIAPDLALRLAAAGIAPDLASRTAAVLDASVAARYGGGDAPELGAAAASGLVDELERGFPSRGI